MIKVQSPTAARCTMYLRSATGDRASLLEQGKACCTAAAGHKPVGAQQYVCGGAKIDHEAARERRFVAE